MKKSNFELTEELWQQERARQINPLQIQTDGGHQWIIRPINDNGVHKFLVTSSNANTVRIYEVGTVIADYLSTLY